MRAGHGETGIMQPRAIKAALVREALALGFGSSGVVALSNLDQGPGNRLRAFLSHGYHGDMSWMATHAERRADPLVLWPEARTALMLALSYAPAGDPLAALEHAGNAAISVYAQGKDYHDVIKKKLKHLAGLMQRLAGGEVKVFVDTAPLMEKPLAAAAGVGWQGKHTNLVSRELGSWFFLGAILTTADLEADKPEEDHCGSCRRCLDICPTRAIPAPYQLDARRCLSYLTIEHKGTIAREFRQAMGNRVYGCDDCLAVCPWNKFAVAAREAALAPRPGAENPPLAELLRLDDAAFRLRFAGSPIKRTGRDRFLRNVLIAAGNSGDRSLLAEVILLLDDAAPLVRAMAVWALKRLAVADVFEKEKQHRLARETDEDVRAEWYDGERAA